MIPSISIKAALDGFEVLGFNTSDLLNAIGIDSALFHDPFASVPDELFGQLWMYAFKQDPDPTLPTRVGLAVPYNAFGMLDHLVGSSTTIGEAFQVLNLFLWLVSIDMSMDFDHRHGDWVWVINDPPVPSRFISEQWTLALIFQRFRQRMPGFRIREVHLSQSATVPAAQFEQYWEVPVRLGQRTTGFRLATGVWELPNQGANPMLQQTLRTVAEQVEIKQFEEAPLIYAIRTRLPEALREGQFSADDIAQELGLSRRTLQRRLSSENITFQQLLDLYRQEQAMQMLQNGETSMVDVAYALGYTEQSSFNRAFRRWTGQSPSTWLREGP